MLIRGLNPARHLLVSAVVLALTAGPLSGGVAAQDGAPVIASGGEAVLLRDAPDWAAAAVSELPDGSSLQITGDPVAAADGSLWSPVNANGASGYVPAGYVGSGSAEMAPADAAPDDTWTSDATEMAVDPAQADIVAPADAPDPVVAQDPIMSPVASVSAATVTDANLRNGPSADASIMQVLPPGTPLSVDGAAQNGFVPVTGGGASGWIAEELLQQAEPVALDPTLAVPVDDSATVTEPPPLVALGATTATMADPEPAENVPAPPPAIASDTSTGIAWPMRGGDWEVVQGYNNGTHTNRSGFATYKYSIDWARVDGNTAGQPIYAPVSGTVEWTDGGSGGILINAGNGYGVALFHVVLNRAGRGDSVTQGDQIGVVAGPGDPGYMNMTHFEIACWKLNANGNHESVPFDGPNTISGQAFPDTGGTNQYMDARVSP